MIPPLLESVPTADPLGLVVQWGVLGIVLLLLVSGYLWPKPAVEALEKRHEADRKAWEERMLVAMEAQSRELRAINTHLAELNRPRDGRP